MGSLLGLHPHRASQTLLLLPDETPSPDRADSSPSLILIPPLCLPSGCGSNRTVHEAKEQSDSVVVIFAKTNKPTTTTSATKVLLVSCCAHRVAFVLRSDFTGLQPGMETPLDVLSRAASLVHADDEKQPVLITGSS
ncbi:hypothetical protein E5288_WYG015684 [Bos mutus]|uniref:Uncharacterized protein n=1 Tax=Bos mutus TaxID=72004 RepID=A0A6B0RZV8_9CETA|nr:hypothetical protein [Bos mutus]